MGTLKMPKLLTPANARQLNALRPGEVIRKDKCLVYTRLKSGGVEPTNHLRLLQNLDDLTVCVSRLFHEIPAFSLQKIPLLRSTIFRGITAT